MRHRDPLPLGSQKILAVVPARAGSKGIDKKNLRVVGGQSLVARVGHLCSSIEWLSKAVISTDSDEIRKEGISNGLDGFFLRPDHLASDTATSHAVWKHALLESEKHYREQFNISILLEPTSPLREVNDLFESVSQLVNEGHTSAVTVSPTPASYTPHKSLEVDDHGFVRFYRQDGAGFSIRQKIPQYFHRNGICYAARREILLDKTCSTILEGDCVAVITDRQVVNIDEPFHIELAEWLLLRREIE